MSGLAGGGPSTDLTDAASPTGYGRGQRELIVPERDETSYEWITQTQQMLAKHEWRVRHVDYDNAPAGRELRATSPYRWWLGLVAWVDRVGSNRPAGVAVEHAALYADPLVHGLALALLTAFVAWRFGGFAAALFATGFVTLFPFAAGFLPGVPDHHGLARIWALGGVLLLLAGLREAGRAPRWFALAGVAGGLSLWIDASTAVPVLAGIFTGGLIAAWVRRRAPAQVTAFVSSGHCWRIWSFAGALTVFVGYLIDYFPGHLGEWQVQKIHPLHALAWLGLGALLAKAGNWGRRENPGWKRGDSLETVLAVVAIAALPIVGWKSSQGLLAKDLLSIRLTNLPGGIVALDFQSWLSRDGLTATVWAVLLPLIVVIPAGWRLVSNKTPAESRVLLAVALGPVLVALGFASQQLSWWSMTGGALLGLMVAATVEDSPGILRPGRLVWTAVALLFAIPGLIQLWPHRQIDAKLVLTAAETEELVERHLAHWLASHADENGSIVFAPPRESLTLGYYGGLRGIGTFAPDNVAGLGATLTIASAKNMEEVEVLIRARGVKYIVIPSWDPFFDEFGRLYLARNFSHRKSFLIGELRRWNLPLWLRPIAYPIPVIGGFETQSVLLFEVVDEQSPAVAVSRLTEYLAEMGSLDDAASIAEVLRRFPADAGALAAQAQVQNAREDAAGFAQTLDLLLARLSGGADRFLPWDRRVSLAVVLAQGNRIDPARAQVRRCLAEIDEKKMKSLSPGSLFKLLVLSHEFQIEIADPRLRALAMELLPAELRSRL